MKIQFAVLLVVLFTGCKEITYQEPQPKGKKSLTRIPKALQGTYFIVERGASPTDTMTITDCCMMDAKGIKHILPLNDSLIIKSYKGYYFANYSSHLKDWSLLVVEPQKNGDLICSGMPTDPKTFSKLCGELSRFVTIDSTRQDGDEKIYRIDPTPKELIKLVKSGVFSEKSLWKKQKP